jgi:dTMP kinase
MILADVSRVHGATSCNETTNERLGVSAANIGRKSAATASVMASNFPLSRQPNKAKMRRSTMALLCRKIVPMPLITFEGSEGCGKSTQVKRLTARLEKCGIAAAVFREPGGTAIGEAIRHLLQHSEDNHAMTPETELLLFEASRRQLVREKIQPALRRAEWVICDRFFDSTTVYQGAARQLDLGLVEKLNAFAVGDCVPDLTFVLDIDRATVQSRLENRKKIRDRMKEESDEFHERVIRAYRELAENEPRRVILIDGRISPDTIESQIWNTFAQRFPDLGKHQTPKTKLQTP